eukprot:evm.model.scf_1048.2 EVM.evm.TU.scf_1048.2   scf_1048:16347-18908(+)
MKIAFPFALLALAAAADASRFNVLDARSLLQDTAKLCWNVSTHSECLDGFWCDVRDSPDCKQQRFCNPDGNGNDNCIYELVCSGVCVEFKDPINCDPEAKYDECKMQLGYGYACMKLDEKVCSYRKECQQVQTDECQEYSYENKCHYEPGACKAYNQEKVCETENVCVEYKQEKKCDRKHVCKEHKQKKLCKPNHTCAEYNAHNECVKYGKDCKYEQGDCKEYEYTDTNCHYMPTTECARHEAKEVDCKHVNKDCKEYDQVQKCVQTKGACKTYRYQQQCEQFEDVCQTGLCGPKAIAPAPKMMPMPEDLEEIPAPAPKTTYEPLDLKASAVAPAVVYAPEAIAPAPADLEEFPAPLESHQAPAPATSAQVPVSSYDELDEM